MVEWANHDTVFLKMPGGNFGVDTYHSFIP